MNEITTGTHDNDKFAGFWITVCLPSYPAQYRYECSECHFKVDKQSGVCPNCGTEMKQFKSCPFCGNTDIKLKKTPLVSGDIQYEGNYEYDIRCDECGCSTALCNMDSFEEKILGMDAEHTLIKAWNERNGLNEEDTDIV